MNTIPSNHHSEDKSLFGFWVYLMTDLIIFAALFAAYTVLHGSTFGAPSGRDLFNLPFVLTETILLLTSSFTCGLAMLFVHMGEAKKVVLLFGITFLLGIGFLGMELFEFTRLFHDGNTFQRSAFLSSFFTLVGTHGLHITSGLFWMALLLLYVLRYGLTKSIVRKLTLLSLFWHFLDIVWIFIFTIVYLMGVL